MRRSQRATTAARCSAPRSSARRSTFSRRSPATARRSSSVSEQVASRFRLRSEAFAFTASTSPRRWSPGCARSRAREQIGVDDRRLRDHTCRRDVLARLSGLQHDRQPDDAGRPGRVLSKRRRPPRARRLLRDRGRHPGSAASAARRDVPPFEVSNEHLGFDEYDVANQGLVSHHFWQRMAGGAARRSRSATCGRRNST